MAIDLRSVRSVELDAVGERFSISLRLFEMEGFF